MYSQRKRILSNLYKKALSILLSLSIAATVLPITLTADAAVVNNTDNPAFSVTAYDTSARINIPFINDASSYKVYLSLLAYQDVSSLTADAMTRCVLSSDTYEPFVYTCNGDADAVDASSTVSINPGTTYYFYLVTVDGSTETLQSAFKTSTKSADDCYWTSSGHYDTGWYTPDAEEYKISTEAQLAGLAVLNNGLNGVLSVNFSGKTIIISESLDLSDWLWTPIGTELKPFKGNVSGILLDSHSGKIVSCTQIIKGLHTNTTSDFQGLFGSVGGTSTIAAIGIVDSYIKGGSKSGSVAGDFEGTALQNCYNTGTVKGTAFAVGGIVGTCYKGSISNSYNIGTVKGFFAAGGVAGDFEGTAIQNCYNTGTVDGKTDIGGVAGLNGGILTACHNTGRVTASENQVGGIAGCSDGAISSCCNSGAVYGAEFVGGIGGILFNGITGCYNTGTIGGTAFIGGISGDINGYYHHTVISNCYNTGAISGTPGNFGGIISFAEYDASVSNSYYNKDVVTSDNGYGTGKTTEEMKALAGTLGMAFVNAPSSYVSGGVFSISNPVNGGYPVLTAFGYTASLDMDSQFEKENGTGCYLVKNAYQLDLIRNYCGSGNSGIVFKLVNNIDLSWAAYTYSGTNLSWQPIGSDSNPFCGTFSGNSYSISGITISGRDAYRGLFGYNSGRIENLGTTEVTITSWGDAGGIAGYNAGTIWNCSSTGIISGILLGDDIGGIAGSSCGSTALVSGCSNACVVSGGGWIGGIVGYCSSVVSDCSNIGLIIGVKFDYSPGNVSQIGGIVGVSSDLLTGCHNKGIICGNRNIGGIAGYLTNIDCEVSGCSNTGRIFGKDQIGGIVGYIRTSNILKNCHNEGTITGTASDSFSIGGIGGKISCYVKSCYNNGAVTGGDAVGGIAGTMECCGFTYCCNTGAIIGSCGAVGGISGSSKYITVNCSYNTGSVTSADVAGGIIGTDMGIPTIQCCYSTGLVQGITKGGIAGSVLSSAYINYNNYWGCSKGISNIDDQNRIAKPFTELASDSVKAAGTTSIINENCISKAYYYINQMGCDFAVSYSDYQADNSDIAAVSGLTVTGGNVGTASINGIITITQNELNMHDDSGFTGPAKTISVPVSMPLTVTQATPALAVSSFPSSVTVGDTLTLTAKISNAYAPTGTVIFYNNGAAVGSTNTINGSVASVSYIPTTANGLSITARYSGDCNNTAAISENTQNVTIAKKSPSLTTVKAAPSSPQSYPITSVSLSTTLNNYYGTLSGQRISFYNGNYCLGTALTDENGAAFYTLTNPGADTYQLTARFDGDSNNNTAKTNISTAYTLLKGTQAALTVSGVPLSPITYGDPAFMLSPSGGSGTNNTYTYFSNNKKVLSVDTNGTVSIKGAGTAVITVIKAGDENYNSTGKDISITIAPKILKVVITPNNKQYDATADGTVKKVDYTGIIGSDDVYLTGGRLSFIDKTAAGSKQVSAFGYVLGGTKAADYSLGDTNVKNADITKKILTVSVRPVIISCGQSIPPLSAEVSGFASGENENNVAGFEKPTASTFYNSHTTTLVTDLPLSVTYSGGNPANNYEFSYSYTTCLTIQSVMVKDSDYQVSGKYSLSENPADWNTDNFTITPSNGYNLISTDGITWVSKLTVSTEGQNRLVTFKLKKTTDGTQTESKTICYNLDKTKPAIRVTGNPVDLVKKARLSISVTAGSSGIKSIMVNGKNITDTYKKGYTVTRNGDYKFMVTSGAGVTSQQLIKVSEIVPTVITDKKTGLAVNLSNVNLPSGVTSVSVSSTLLPESDSVSGVHAIVKGLITSSNPGSLSSLAVYDLKLLDQNGKPISNFTGKIKVMLPIPANISGVPSIFWYDPAKGTLTDMNAVQQDGCMVFETTHFSYYAVAVLKSARNSTPNPPAGRGNTLIFLLVLLGMGTAGFVVVKKRRKYRVKK